MSVSTRVPDWTVTIKRPDYNKTTLTFLNVPSWNKNTTYQGGVNTVNFVSRKNRINALNNYDGLKSYEYSNSINSPAGAFSLEFTAKLDANNRNWKDKLRQRDIVYIYEFGKLRYIGIIKVTGYKASMSGENPVRDVVISGESIGGMLESFDLPMNLYLWYGKGATAEAKNTDFINAMSANLEENKKIGSILKKIQESFFDVNFGSGLGSSGFSSIISKYYKLQADDISSNYPLNLKPFQTESNTLWSLFRQILPKPIYEIFGRYEDGKYNLICREAPFDLDSWNNLKSTVVEPAQLISHELSDSDNEVYSHYYSTMPLSGYSPNETYANQVLSEVSVLDEEKFPIYGYKQLEANFPFFDLVKGKTFDTQEYLKINSVRLYAWYRNNREFQSGQISLMTAPDKENNLPKVGEKLQDLRGDGNKIEFYIEDIKRSMVYPETMKSAYTVTRGYEYTKKGVTVPIDGKTIKTPQVGKIRQLGMKLRLSEAEEI